MPADRERAMVCVFCLNEPRASGSELGPACLRFAAVLRSRTSGPVTLEALEHL